LRRHQRRVRAEHVGNRLGIDIQIEQLPAACDCQAQIAQVVQPQPSDDLVGTRRRL